MGFRFSRHREELTYHGCAAVDFLIDHLQAFLNLRRGQSLLADERSIASNDVQNIVEIVSNAASERADAFNFLRLAQLPFEYFLLRDGFAQRGGCLCKIRRALLNSSFQLCIGAD